MLSNLLIERYRCYERHELEFRPKTILVGANNAGKSTVVEALRLVSLVCARHRGLAWRPPPAWTGASARLRGAQPSLSNISFDPRTVIYQYEDPPARILATFGDGQSVEVFVGPPEGEELEPTVYAVVRDSEGVVVATRQAAQHLQLPQVAILPQPGPLLWEERPLDPAYVRSKLHTDLASRHFRNQIGVERDVFPHFKELAEDSWPGLQVREYVLGDWLQDSPPQLILRDGDFAAEVGAMGHGLQMWLQTMWFLARNRAASAVILDEPDVYRHPDLQRKLIRMVRRRFPQVLIATHSVEMMAEASAGEVLIIDRRSRQSRYANANPQVQRAIDSVGGIHNLHLARLVSARRVLLVEGKDIALLRPLHEHLSGVMDVPLDNVPSMSVGGWTGWPTVVGSGLFLQNAVGENIRAYAIFDSDYRLPDEIMTRYADGREKNVHVHIWRRKSIENYLVHPAAIMRVLQARAVDPTTVPIRDMLEA